ncbi:phospholipase [Halomonas campisalis]|uniref:phospholipase D n=1 Tax=Billgrantia campisalis TaxID=74661 RepID=A0ABS9PA81_9GAMM|nr:phospholipase D-like domain-containing protein [Halomonas campisalis]MCG6658666.1 phospholipase [Halomonas campisalis]MDR5864068.1 phospholipase D-like domain-containing protein [Halomonas campisalis]
MSAAWMLPLGLGLALYLATVWWHSRKPLPPGLRLAGPWRGAAEARLLRDETFIDTHGRQRCRQQVVDELLALIGQARRLIVIDIFQLNDPDSAPPDCHRRVAAELIQALLARKREVPALEIVLITDPINHVYGGQPAGHFDALRQAGIRVVETHLPASRDPNPSWSALWRLTMRWWGNSPRGGWLPNPLGPGKVTLRSYLASLNLNANHRKTLVADHGDDWRAVVSSCNLNDTSSNYRELGLTFAGPAALDLLDSERQIAAYSGASVEVPALPPVEPPRRTAPRLRVLGEGAIRDALLETIDDARPGERLDIEVLYLSHRGLITALRKAHRRGVALRVLLDPSKAHFGRPSPGIPNRPVARELHDAGIAVRWSDTRREQAHAKLLLRSGEGRPAMLLLGSANFTRRSLDDLNLEANVQLEAESDHPAMADAHAAFKRHWHNGPEEHYSADYPAYADRSRLRYWRYRVMEASGWCTF